MKRFLTFLFTMAAVASADAAGRSVTYEVDGAAYEGYYIRAGAKAPLVLIIHDWNGLDDYEIRRSRMLAELGYSVFAADLFGAGVRPAATEEKRRLTTELYGNREKMRSLIAGALEKARSLGADTGNAVIMGYCFGGAAALEFARSGAELKGFATFHGGLSTPEGQDYSKTRGRLLIMHGTADSVVSMDDFAGLARTLEKSGVSHEMITYSGAPHAFTVFGAESYREDADRKSWRRFTEFLAEALKQTPD